MWNLAIDSILFAVDCIPNDSFNLVDLATRGVIESPDTVSKQIAHFMIFFGIGNGNTDCDDEVAKMGTTGLATRVATGTQ